ncbi:MAG TPA: hypothetical protein VIY29_02365, partial [Ktedonobacteraceae bacterium]
MLKNTLGTRGSPYGWRIVARIVAPIVISLLSLFVFTPSAFAASHNHASANTHSMTHYLALGDSL